jgi:Arc/MetJ-type ribon-helix-helix transcriptional regulator
MPKRVVFSFDDRSLESLERMTQQGKYPSMANAVRDSLQITRALQSQAERGFTEIIVRNPETGEERVIVVPELHVPPK